VDEPACVVVRGTIEQEPLAHGTKSTVPSPAPFSLASYGEVMSGLPQIPEPFVAFHNNRSAYFMSVVEVIVLQKSKVASVRIFGETLKDEAIDDSYNLSRATEVA
jgi:hypothetical protein